MSIGPTAIGMSAFVGAADPGYCAFYAGLAGGITATTVKIRFLPLGADETVADARSVLEGVVAGVLVGTAVAWIRNLYVR